MELLQFQMERVLLESPEMLPKVSEEVPLRFAKSMTLFAVRVRLENCWLLNSKR